MFHLSSPQCGQVSLDGGGSGASVGGTERVEEAGGLIVNRLEGLLEFADRLWETALIGQDAAQVVVGETEAGTGGAIGAVSESVNVEATTGALQTDSANDPAW